MLTIGDADGLNVGSIVGMVEDEGISDGAAVTEGLVDGLGPGPVGDTVGAAL